MMLKQLAALSAALCGGAEAFANVQTKERASLAQFMTNDFDKYYEVELDRHGKIRDINASDLNRREAIAKGAAAASAAGAVLSDPGAAYSDDASDGAIGFSKSTSDAWRASSSEPEPVDPTARATASSGGRTLADQFIKEEIGQARANNPPRPGSLAEQFVREESGRASSTRGPVSSPVSSTAAPQPTPSVAKPVVFSAKQLGAGAALSIAAASYNAEYGDYSDKPAIATNVERVSDSISIDEIAEEETVQALVEAPIDAEPIIVQESSDEGTESSDEVVTASPWDNPWFKAPVPYGMQNKARNPFIEQVEEYCVGGQVTPECTGTIKTYLDELSSTGAVAKRGEARAIAGYLDSLGGNPSESGKQAGAAFTSYLDALSSGSAPPPKSAAAVMGYLDRLNTNSQKPYSAIQVPEWKLREYFGIPISPLGGQQPTPDVKVSQPVMKKSTPAQPYTPIEIPEWKLREYFGVSDVQAQAEVQQVQATDTSLEQAPTIPSQPYNPIEIPEWKLREYFGVSDVQQAAADAEPRVEVVQNQANYLDNLSTSSPQPGPYTSVEIPEWKLREYFGVPDTTPKVGIQANVDSRPDSDPLPPPAPIGGVFDGRLTLIEDRVADLEIKVNEIPDQVYAKIETWQTSQFERLSNEVKRIVEAMENNTSPPLPPPTDVVVGSSSTPIQGTSTEPEAISVTIGERAISTSPRFASTASTTVQSSSSVVTTSVSTPSTKKKGWGKSGASWKKNPPPKSGSGGYLDNLKP